jgi:SAM-dependent methyltransferase
MHDTALAIGKEFFRLYARRKRCTIVEVGSMDVNGGLRDVAPEHARYVGIDLSPGPGVDLVLKDRKKLPVPRDHADLVVSSSAMEHDPTFWITFVAMCRACKPGGYIYINVPSNGFVHSFPVDCWRFYPDAGQALEAYSREEGSPTTLIESFVANRVQDHWNDFVAVFRRDAARRHSGKDRLYKLFPCRNVYDWKLPDRLFVEHPTEDQMIAQRLRAELAATSDELRVARQQAQVEKACRAGHEADLDGMRTLLQAERKQGEQDRWEADTLRTELHSEKQRLVTERRQWEADRATLAAESEERARGLQETHNSSQETQRQLASVLSEQERLKAERIQYLRQLGQATSEQEQLRADLAGQVQGAEQLRSELAGQAQTQQRLLAELAEHVRSQEQLRAELAGLVQSREQLRSELAGQVQAQERLLVELAGQVQNQEYLRAELATRRQQLLGERKKAGELAAYVQMYHQTRLEWAARRKSIEQSPLFRLDSVLARYLNLSLLGQAKPAPRYLADLRENVERTNSRDGER